MSRVSPPAPRHSSFDPVEESLRHVPFEAFAIDRLVDDQGRFEIVLDRAFPFVIKAYDFSAKSLASRFNWHERLEIWVPVSGAGRFRMGDREVAFSAGDILVIDNLKFHGLVDFQGDPPRGLAICLHADLVCRVGSPPCDYPFLTPFFGQAEARDPVLRANDELAPVAHAALAGLLHSYFPGNLAPPRQAGCKAYLLELLFHLACHFEAQEQPRREIERKQRQAQRLGALIEYVEKHHDEKISIARAASLARMSTSRFTRFFRQATGTTFVEYLTDLRLERGLALLQTTELSIAEIADAVGFSDQSYFDRRFKRRYGKTPRVARTAPG